MSETEQPDDNMQPDEAVTLRGLPVEDYLDLVANQIQAAIEPQPLEVFRLRAELLEAVKKGLITREQAISASFPPRLNRTRK